MGVCASNVADAPVQSASSSANPATAGASKSSSSSGPSGTEARAQSMVRKARANIYTQVTISATYDKVNVAKTADQREFLQQVIEEFHMFQDLDYNSKVDLVNAMAPSSVGAGQNIIDQGDAVADYFYVVDDGEFCFRKDGVVVGNPCRRGQIFGELALLYGCPRAATVSAVADSTVWQLDRTSFRNIVAHNTQGAKETTLDVLDNVEHLKDLNPTQKLRLVDALCETTYQQGELIIKKGDPGTIFYIIKDGTVECTGLPDGGANTLTKGQYFGERALLLGEERACNVTVVSPFATCLLLDKVDFYELLGEGQLHEVMARNIGVRALGAIKALEMLDDFQRQQVAEACIFQLCNPGDAIVTKGEVGDKFYVITQGEVTVQIDGGDDKVLKMGEYFGEQALLNDAPRSATIVANNAVVCLTMLRSDFVALLGPLDAIKQRSADREARIAEMDRGRGMKAPAASLADLVVKQTLGRGTFGRVKLVVHKTSGEYFAMKVLSKSLVVAYVLFYCSFDRMTEYFTILILLLKDYYYCSLPDLIDIIFIFHTQTIIIIIYT